MATILLQQRLLLELLIMSGDIAVHDTIDGTILQYTLKKYGRNAWIKNKYVVDGFDVVTISNHGKHAARQA